MLRLLVVFLHVCGAMGLFGAAAIEGASLLEFRRAGRSGDSFQGFAVARRLGSLSFALVVLSGLFLTQTVWGWQTDWIRVAMSSIVVMMLIGATANRRAMATLRVAPASGAAYDALVTSFLTRLGILVGIVFLMTVKPPLLLAVTAVGAATGVGFLAGLPSDRGRASRAA